MMKKSTMLLMCVSAACMLALVFTGCSGSKKGQDAAITSQTIGDTLLERLSINEMTQVQAENIPSRFDITEEILQSACVYVSLDSNAADEIDVFQVKQKQDVDTVYAALSIHNNQKAQTFKVLDANEYQKVRNTLLVRRELFVIMVTTDQPWKANAIIDHYFPGSENLAKQKK